MEYHDMLLAQLKQRIREDWYVRDQSPLKRFSVRQYIRYAKQVRDRP